MPGRATTDWETASIAASSPQASRAYIRFAWKPPASHRGGKPFFRVALAEIEAIAQPATIGATTDSGVDSNGDGKNEAIRINTAVNVIAGGDYVLNFGLFDAQGKLYGVTRVLSLEAGSHLVTTELPAQDLARAGLSNGPYEIRGLVLSRRA
mgnify:CR=1 FL=1